MHGQLANHTPGDEAMSIVSVEATAGVDVHCDWRQLSAHDPDCFKTDAVLVGEGRRQQWPRLDGNAHTRLILQHAFPENAFEEQAGIRELESWARLQAEFGDGLPIGCNSIIENQAGYRDSVLMPGMLEVEIAELDLDLLPIGNRRIRRNEGPVRPRRCREEQDPQDDRDAPNR